MVAARHDRRAAPEPSRTTSGAREPLRVPFGAQLPSCCYVCGRPAAFWVEHHLPLGLDVPMTLLWSLMTMGIGIMVAWSRHVNVSLPMCGPHRDLRAARDDARFRGFVVSLVAMFTVPLLVSWLVGELAGLAAFVVCGGGPIIAGLVLRAKDALDPHRVWVERRTGTLVFRGPPPAFAAGARR